MNGLFTTISTLDQYVCLVCGYNMVGFFPARCPFCGAERINFITSEECSERFEVKEIPVSTDVTRLNSYPSLGIEHAAYRIETGDRIFMVDCPSSFDTSLKDIHIITFTHHHFLGASNLYRDHFDAQVRLHQKDSENTLCLGFTFDYLFEGSFVESALEACHLDGHTLGFTAYIFKDHLFICDYVFFKVKPMSFNPYGPEVATRQGARDLIGILNDKDISVVCGYNYVCDYGEWIVKFKNLVQ